MNMSLTPGERSGTVSAPSSKSAMHRLVIAACLGKNPVTLTCDRLSDDTEATINCMRAIGADIKVSGGVIEIQPVKSLHEGVCHLYCRESGSTLRFLIPIAGALGIKAVFHMEGRLSKRPLSPLWEELCSHGMVLRQEDDLLFCEGRLSPGSYSLPGNVSSQYVTGLLLALPLLDGDSTLTVTGEVQSSAYIILTEKILALAGIKTVKNGFCYSIKGGAEFSLPPLCPVEGDWSNGAFFLCMGALSESGISVSGLDIASSQGDKAVLDILRAFCAEVLEHEGGITVKKGGLRGITIDAGPIPDLIPTLSVVAAAAEGESRIINARRLRLKESDRLTSTAALINSLGGKATELPEGLVIEGGGLRGGTADSFSDHRIAMAAAVAACTCKEPVEVIGSECVAKSFPHFWDVYNSLSGGGL